MTQPELSRLNAILTMTAETKLTKVATPEDFITRWPLYNPAAIEGFIPPARVSLHCDILPTCGKETTWLRGEDAQYIQVTGYVGAGFKWVWYTCGLCNRNYLVVMYRELERKERSVPRSNPNISTAPQKQTVVTKVQKVGQYPAQSIDVPKGLQKNLGDDAISLYKKALANRNEGFGLGAVAYIRRVVEDKTNELIEVAALLAESHDVDRTIVQQIRAAATEHTTYDQKLKIASTVFPQALLIEGLNPLKELYGLVSEGIHGLTEEQCIAVADETSSVFEFVFTNLRATTEARHGFVEKVRKWAGRGKGNTPAEIPDK